jgi:hypothetical protein
MFSRAHSWRWVVRAGLVTLMAAALSAACADRDASAPASERATDVAAEPAVLDSAALAQSVLPDSASLMEVDAPPADLEQVRRVVEEYYAAIGVKDYQRAFARWGDRGRASGQTYLEFVAGFANTESVAVAVGEPGRIEGAAGSRYVEVPVAVTAVIRGGDRQRFEGSYTLRRTVVEGATPEQRQWHLHDGKLTRVR